MCLIALSLSITTSTSLVVFTFYDLKKVFLQVMRHNVLKGSSVLVPICTHYRLSYPYMLKSYYKLLLLLLLLLLISKYVFILGVYGFKTICKPLSIISQTHIHTYIICMCIHTCINDNQCL